MKIRLIVVILIFTASLANAQEIQTLFGKGNSTSGYGALSNKFTTINGTYANLSEVYGGVFINRRWMVGMGFAASTNDIRVPQQHSVNPLIPMTYQYGQGGLMLERVIKSNRSIHLVVNLFSGVGFTAQYNRPEWGDWDDFDTYTTTHDENWFYVLEPGAQLEMNLFRWLRLSPGISYRNTYGSEGRGLSDNDLSNWSYNITLKFGGFGKRNRIKHSTEVISN
ncbi:MAG TPA: hypothetical protein PLM56_04910 [Cyclobacteriaceae bacterium]|jgi:hypothetical protein|nr:hypothetical protein [Cytophagales bacterium]HRE66365.1 hypothetical protein [Cyclobacteriaceae bacterium]HRF32813.1 hypothetical protein [Cyclobacteriaceae bacterium]